MDEKIVRAVRTGLAADVPATPAEGAAESWMASASRGDCLKGVASLALAATPLSLAARASLAAGGRSPLEDWPTPLATIPPVSGEANVRGVLTGPIAAGTLIEITDGTYGGVPIEIVADGTATNPIVITARNVGQARFTCAIVIRGDHVWLRGFKFDDAGTFTDPNFEFNEVGGNIVIYGTGVRILRNTFLRRNIGLLEKTCIGISNQASAPAIAYDHFDYAINTSTSGFVRPTDANNKKYNFNYLFFELGNGQPNSGNGIVERNHFRRSPGLDLWGGTDVEYGKFKNSMFAVGRLDLQE